MKILKPIKLLFVFCIFLLSSLASSYASWMDLSEGYQDLYWGESLTSVKEDYKLRNRKMMEGEGMRYTTSPRKEEPKDICGFRLDRYWLFFDNDRLKRIIVCSHPFDNTEANRQNYFSQVVKAYQEYYQAEPETVETDVDGEKIFKAKWDKREDVRTACSVEYWTGAHQSLAIIYLDLSPAE